MAAAALDDVDQTEVVPDADLKQDCRCMAHG
jgi:hypothetical protein